MVLEDLITEVRDDTKYPDDAVIIRKLNSGMDWAWNRIYAVYPKVRIIFETTGTLATETQLFDLATALLPNELWAISNFWIKTSSESKYTPVHFVDVSDPLFIAMDQETARVLHPVTAAIVNFNQIRFAPALPSGVMWRADYVGKPGPLALSTNCVTSVPSPLHGAMVAYAVHEIWHMTDDDREEGALRTAIDLVTTGIHNLKRRDQDQPKRTRPYPPRGFGMWPR